MSKDQMPAENQLLGDFSYPDLDSWRTEVERLLKGAPFAKKMFTKTMEGITVGPMYTAQDVEDLPWMEHYPGQAPFVRGYKADGSSRWVVAQSLVNPTAEEFNNALRHDLKRGQDVVNLTLDLAGLLGHDPDQAPVESVGKGGTSIASLADLETALDGVDLNETPIILQCGSSALPMAAVLAALVKKQGKDLGQLRGCLGCDPVYGLAEKGTLPVELDHVYDELEVLTRWAMENATGLKTLPVNEIPWHLGGADSALSLGLTLASGVQALRAMEEKGLELEESARNVVFRMVMGTDFFMEIAKLRALRLLWSDILSASGCSADSAKTLIHAQTSLRCMTVLDPHVNLLRSTTMAMSAVMGGADQLHVAPFDSTYSMPDNFSRRIARNLQLLLAQECHFDHVADPAGGSWYVEKLTAELAAKAWGVFQEIEAAGGIIAALKTGQIQERISAVAESRKAGLATGKEVLVGTNKYANPQEAKLEANMPDYQQLQEKRSEAMARQRTAAAHEDHLLVLKRLEKVISAEPPELFSTLMDAAAHGATLGELTGILRHEDDTDFMVEAIPLRRDAEPFENLRAAVAAAGEYEPRRSKVFFACLKDFARYMPRVDFVRGFFQAGGFEVVVDQFYENADDLAEAVKGCDAATVVLVGLDKTYGELALPVTRRLMALSPKVKIMLAGKPGDLEAELSEAGVSEFIHVRSNILDVLGGILNDTEVGA